MKGLRNAAAVLVFCALAGCAPRAALQPPGYVRDHVFDKYSSLSTNREIARRTLTPLTYRALEQAVQKGQPLREQPIDLAKEKFVVYVPAGPAPQSGYGLVVFIAPWFEATRPIVWRPPLDKHGLLLVTIENAGNEVKILDRRMPLAVLAYENVRARYPVDLTRVYVYGMSGGSETAEMVAVAYPDVFRGVLLNAGSWPIGGHKGVCIPPAELFHQLQRNKLVYSTGKADETGLVEDQVSRDSMKDHCVFGIESQYPLRLGHEPLDATSFDRALDELERLARVNEAELAKCNARLERELAAEVAAAEAALARGDTKGAEEMIKAIDRRYGGLGAKAVIELDAKRRAGGSR